MTHSNCHEHLLTKNVALQDVSQNSFQTSCTPGEVFTYHYDEETSLSEDSMTRLLENTLDCDRIQDEMGGVGLKETSLVEYRGQVAMAKESRI